MTDRDIYRSTMGSAVAVLAYSSRTVLINPTQVWFSAVHRPLLFE